MLYGSVSRAVRGQHNINKLMFFKALNQFGCLTEFATDKRFSCETEFLYFTKESNSSRRLVCPFEHKGVRLRVRLYIFQLDKVNFCRTHVILFDAYRGEFLLNEREIGKIKQHGVEISKRQN